MTFENLINIIDFLNKHLDLVKDCKSNPFSVKSEIYGNELIIGFDSITYTYVKYFVLYKNITHTVEVCDKLDRDLLECKCNELIKNIIDYSKNNLLYIIENYESIGRDSIDSIIV